MEVKEKMMIELNQIAQRMDAVAKRDVVHREKMIKAEAWKYFVGCFLNNPSFNLSFDSSGLPIETRIDNVIELTDKIYEAFSNRFPEIQ